MYTHKNTLRKLLSLLLMPAAASAINCDFGCKGSHCHQVVNTAFVASNASLNYEFGHAYALPSLGVPATPGGAGLSDICDQVVTHAAGSYSMTHVERPLASRNVHRQRVDLDLSGVQAQVHSGTGGHSWWRGLVVWSVPVQAAPLASELRLDYTGTFAWPWQHYQSRLRVLLDEQVLTELNPLSPQVAAELRWGQAGAVVLAIGEFTDAGASRKGPPLRLTEIEIPGTHGLGVVPTHMAVGRMGDGVQLGSTGVLRAASYLVLPLSAP